MQEWVRDAMAPHYTLFHDEVVIPLKVLSDRLEVPEWEVYQQSLQVCVSDLLQSSQSSYRLFLLTFKPFGILGIILLRFLGKVAHVAFKLFLEKAWISIRKGGLQAKEGALWFYQFQKGLSQAQVLTECGVLVSLVVLYYFGKWLKEQTYGERAILWCKQRKRDVNQALTRTVHRVAKVSKILALTMPHLAFLGGGLAFKLFLPSIFRWLAYETYFTELLSVVYPLVMTLIWIYECRHGWGDEKDHKKAIDTQPAVAAAGVSTTAGTSRSAKLKTWQFEKKKGSASPASNKRSTLAPTNRSNLSRRRNGNTKSTGSTAKTTRASPTRSSPGVKGNKKSSIQDEALAASEIYDKDAAVTFWLQYWGVYALAKCFGNLCTMVPVFGRFVAKHPFFLSLCCEIRLLFFVWFFTMEMVLGSSNAGEDAFLAETMPVRLLHTHINPLLLDFEAFVAQAFPKPIWESLVGKAQKVVDLLVMLRFISESTNDWIIHMLQESRPLVLPSLSLLMPGFVTQFGVAYVQFVVPAARSAQANNQVLYLQYWVLHCAFTFVLWLLPNTIWWIPFSTHAVFLTWCHLTLPQTIKKYYKNIENDLIAFGLLKTPRNHVVDPHKTKTARLLTMLADRIPRASQDDEDATTGESVNAAGTQRALVTSNQKKKGASDNDGFGGVPNETSFDSLESIPSLSQQGSSRAEEEEEGPPLLDNTSSNTQEDSATSEVSVSKENKSKAVRRSTRSRVAAQQ